MDRWTKFGKIGLGFDKIEQFRIRQERTGLGQHWAELDSNRRDKLDKTGLDCAILEPKHYFRNPDVCLFTICSSSAEL